MAIHVSRGNEVGGAGLVAGKVEPFGNEGGGAGNFAIGLTVGSVEQDICGGGLSEEVDVQIGSVHRGGVAAEGEVGEGNGRGHGINSAAVFGTIVEEGGVGKVGRASVQGHATAGTGAFIAPDHRAVDAHNRLCCLSARSAVDPAAGISGFVPEYVAAGEDDLTTVINCTAPAGRIVDQIAVLQGDERVRTGKDCAAFAVRAVGLVVEEAAADDLYIPVDAQRAATGAGDIVSYDAVFQQRRAGAVDGAVAGRLVIHYDAVVQVDRGVADGKDGAACFAGVVIAE